jgi:hypothetical protein
LQTNQIPQPPLNLYGLATSQIPTVQCSGSHKL